MNKIAYFEVCKKIDSNLSRRQIEDLAKESIDYLTNLGDATFDVYPDKDFLPVHKSIFTPGISKFKWRLEDHVDSMIFTNSHEKLNNQILSDYSWKIFVYSLSNEETATETIQHESEELNVASHVILPALQYKGLWESLYYDSNVKDNLLQFVETAMIFSEKKVDPNIVSWNKVVLLHGPPGTGKTSLCKALAQKVAIRLGGRYSFFELVEINSHSLFSKWFSESGKLVMKLFDEVQRLLENPETLVCVLIDEIESLAHARKSCTNGTEPSDAIRVVNALLTQLDRIKGYPNVLILTTSNVTEAIDLAFVDRADIKQYIGHPQQRAIYQIYRSCLHELMRTDLLMKSSIHPFESPSARSDSEHTLGVRLRIVEYENADSDDAAKETSLFLQKLCKRSIGLSGRTLRKLPFLAYAMHIPTEKCSLQEFLEAMETIIEKQIEDDKLVK